MANEQRMKRNFLLGQTATLFAAGATTLTDISFAKIPAVPSAAHLALTFQDLAAGIYEIIYVIAHGAGSKTITVQRAREGSAQHDWPSGTTWVHAPTVRDQLSGSYAQSQLKSGTNYPAAWTATGTRNITLTAYANDYIEVGFSVEVYIGFGFFDVYTIVGGKRITRVSTKQTAGVQGAGSAFAIGMPGAFALPGAAVGRIALNHVSHFRAAAADIATNGTITLMWVTQGPGNSSGDEPFNTDSGDGFKQGSASGGGSINLQLNSGLFWARNIGPQLYAG